MSASWRAVLVATATGGGEHNRPKTVALTALCEDEDGSLGELHGVVTGSESGTWLYVVGEAR